MLAGRTFLAAAVVAAAFGLATPALAGEGSPDIDLGPYGNWGNGPNYPYVSSEPGYAIAPAYPVETPFLGRAYEPEGNVGYLPRRRVIPDESYGTED